jgi:DNA-binding response OmpR family regulator
VHILLVEDDSKLAKILITVFKNSSYVVTHALNVEQGLEAVLAQSFDLIILDWMLEKQTGLELLRELRSYGIATPVLMLTAMSSTQEKVRALDLGADDYLTKPFSTEELLARVRALTRRENLQKQSLITLGPLTLNTIERAVFDSDKPLDLTAKEFDLLEYMIRNKNSVFTRIQLAEVINRDLDYSAMSNVVDVHIRNIRKKISSPKLIETVHGVGYCAKELAGVLK